MNTEKNNEDLKQSSIIYLQYLWRKKFKLLTTHHIIEHLLSLGLTHEYIESINFESIVVFLREPKIVSASKACLLRIHKLCILRHGSSNILENINVRTFLASLMIVYHPTNIFEEINTLENSLFESSKKMLTNFQNICNIIHLSANHSFKDVPYEMSKDFMTMVFEYMKCFNEWKKPDAIKLVSRIKDALIALYNAKEQLPYNELNSSNFEIELNLQIEKLRNKLSDIAGLETLSQFDEEINSSVMLTQFDKQLNSRINK